MSEYYPKGHRGRPPVGTERMFCIYLMQQRYWLIDPAMEENLYDIEAMTTRPIRNFVFLQPTQRESGNLVIP